MCVPCTVWNVAFGMWQAALMCVVRGVTCAEIWQHELLAVLLRACMIVHYQTCLGTPLASEQGAT